ncbi:MAG: hypothetical protein ACLFTE_05190 [Salinivenus sp.]
MMPLRPRSWILLAVVGLFLLGGCEPYMSMTDQVPAQTRRAANLLPGGPRFVGMVDLERAVQQVDELQDLTADSLRAGGPPPLRAFFDATGMDPQTDLKAVYGTIEEGDPQALSAVVFADLTADQMDRFLDEAPDVSVERSTHRGVPLYRVPLRAVAGDEEAAGDSTDEQASPDALHLAFVDNGTVGVALDADGARAMVDRHQGDGSRLGDDDAYMTLVQRLGRDRTAWVAGRNVLETALDDSLALGTEDAVASDEDAEADESGATHAGIQRSLVQWSNRVLGLSEMSSGVSSGVSALEEKTDGKVGELKDKIREQALALTLTDETVEGEAYLTMSDDASAGNVTEMAEGLLAVLRLSKNEFTDRQQDLLDQAAVERDGALVRVQFSLARELLRRGQDESSETAARVRGPVGGTARAGDASVRPPKEATRRLSGIMHPLPL